MSHAPIPTGTAAPTLQTTWGSLAPSITSALCPAAVGDMPLETCLSSERQCTLSPDEIAQRLRAAELGGLTTAVQQALAQHRNTHTQPLLEQPVSTVGQRADAPSPRHEGWAQRCDAEECARDRVPRALESQEWAIVGCWRATRLVFYNLWGIVSKEARAAA